MSKSSSKEVEDCRKRNLPSWMSGRPDAVTAAAPISDPNKDFSKIMKGVVFALSGFVNPERGMLRSQAIEMGAEYQPDWNSGCTLLVCAFHNTPKFRQVEADSGTIVSKEWISECFNQKKLVEIEPYLMNAGKPWRRQSMSDETKQDLPSSSRKSQKQEKSSHPKPTASALSRAVHANHKGDSFSPSKVKQWASGDFRRTIAWLENQDEKPDKSDMKLVAAEGILTCLQDAIDALKGGQNVKQITEEWSCIPRAVEELIKLNDTPGNQVSVDKDDLYKQAMEFKRIYEVQYSKMEEDSSAAAKNLKTKGKGKHMNEDKGASENETAYDSDETIEMTEEEIGRALDNFSSKVVDSR